MKKLLVAAATLVASIPAQNRMGTFDNTGTSSTTRGYTVASQNNPAVMFTRIDKTSYAGWTTGAVPGMRDLTGINFVIQDQDLATQDGFSLVVYGEDPAVPNYPLATTPIATTGLYGLPLGTGGAAYNASVNFTTPVAVPATVDAFVGLSFASAWTIVAGTITDGLSVWEIRGGTGTGTIDLAGAARPTAPQDEGTFSGVYVPTPATGPTYVFVPAAFPTMYKIQAILPIAGGAATAVTNQTTHTESTAASVAGFTVQAPGAGTACMLSGSFPDAANPSLNLGRADDIGQIYVNTAANVPAGSLVFYLIDIGGFGMELPVSSFLPGSTGVTCLNLGTMQTLAIGVMGTGFASNVVAFPAITRTLLTGTTWMQQAVGFNLSTLRAHAGPCTAQRF